ncbi:hypothetical protein [Companilactobacillus suantsaicola]|nr:hypothetical protein [Companilactobacillus suantsaicola]
MLVITYSQAPQILSDLVSIIKPVNDEESSMKGIDSLIVAESSGYSFFTK